MWYNEFMIKPSELIHDCGDDIFVSCNFYYLPKKHIERLTAYKRHTLAPDDYWGIKVQRLNADGLWSDHKFYHFNDRQTALKHLESLVRYRLNSSQYKEVISQWN